MKRLVTALLLSGVYILSTIVPATTVLAQETPKCFVTDQATGRCLDQYYIDQGIIRYDPRPANCSSVDGANATVLAGADNREKIWNYLIAKGLSQPQTAGVMGNLQTESGGSWSPTVNEYGQEFGSAGYGLAQWTGGRRDALVAHLNTVASEQMVKYYNADYSTAAAATTQEEGFIPKNTKTDTLMPVADNDTLLLAQLNFLYDESKARTISQTSIDRGLGQAGDTEWDALKKLTSIEDAATLWVYSFERPANIEATAIVRAGHGKTIFEMYSDGTSTTGECASADKQALAKQIIESGNVVYFDSANQGAREIIEGIANGTNDGNSYPCGVNLLILQMIAAMTESHQIQITSLNRACIDDQVSAVSTRHYNGNGSAIDLDWIDRQLVEFTPGGSLVVELITPFLVPGSRVGQSQCSGLSLSVPEGVTRFPDTCHHLHIDVPPNADPSLKCITPVTAGGCDESQRV